jgi:hypothetical protein
MKASPSLVLLRMLGCFAIWAFSSAPVAAMQEIDWLALGDLRGFIAPCGCDPHTDLGGIKRIATLLTRELASHPSMLVLHLGNSVTLEPQETHKNEFIQKALAQLSITVSLYNEGEILHPQELADLPYVLSNAKKKGPFQILRRVGQYEFWGFTWAESVENEVHTWAQFETLYHQEWKKTDPRLQRILLFSGPTTMLQAASLHPWALIVSANTHKYAEVIGDEERQDPSRLIRLEHPFVRMVPLAGQGILRGGSLTLAEAPSLSSLLHIGSPGKENPLASLERIEVTWLGPHYEDGSPLASLFATYEKEEADYFEKERERKKSQQLHSNFVGAETCKTCHSHAYEVWKGSHHGKAHATLQEKNKHHISECVGCHVVGFSQPGGFISVEDTPHLAGVQCENCHGPRKDHVSNPSLKGEKTAPCTTCHTQPHSPSFSKSTYWERIKH